MSIQVLKPGVITAWPAVEYICEYTKQSFFQKLSDRFLRLAIFK